MAKRFGRICGRGGKKLTRGDRFLVIKKSGVIYDMTKEFTGKSAKSDRRKKRATPAKRKSPSNYGRKRSGPIKGFASRKQKKAALRNVKKAQRARKRRY